MYSGALKFLLSEPHYEVFNEIMEHEELGFKVEKVG